MVVGEPVGRNVAQDLQVRDAERVVVPRAPPRKEPGERRVPLRADPPAVVVYARLQVARPKPLGKNAQRVVRIHERLANGLHVGARQRRGGLVLQVVDHVRFQRPHAVVGRVLVKVQFPKLRVRRWQWRWRRLGNHDGQPEVNDDGRVRFQVHQNVLQLQVVMHDAVLRQPLNGLNQILVRVKNAGNDFFFVVSHAADVVVKIQAVNVGHLHQGELRFAGAGFVFIGHVALVQRVRVVAAHLA